MGKAVNKTGNCSDCRVRISAQRVFTSDYWRGQAEVRFDGGTWLQCRGIEIACAWLLSFMVSQREVAAKTASHLDGLGLTYEVHGGGRIHHRAKKVEIYGHSYGFPWKGEPRHAETAEICKVALPGHEVIWHNDGYWVAQNRENWRICSALMHLLSTSALAFTLQKYIKLSWKSIPMLSCSWRSLCEFCAAWIKWETSLYESVHLLWGRHTAAVKCANKMPYPS